MNEINDEYINADEYINGLQAAIKSAGFHNLLDFLQHAAAASDAIREDELEALVDTAFEFIEREFDEILSEINYDT